MSLGFVKIHNAYSNNNPVNYIDTSGHFAIPVIILSVIKIVSTAIDWGWTAYDTLNYVSTAINPNNTNEIKNEAWVNAAVAVGMELIEPDEEFSPAALPIDDMIRHSDGFSDGLIRLVRNDQIGTSQPFKLRKGEDGLSVFEGITPEELLETFPGKDVPNTTIIIPKDKLPLGTEILSKLDPNLPERLSEAHRILIRPEGWSIDGFAKALKKIVGWE